MVSRLYRNSDCPYRLAFAVFVIYMYVLVVYGEASTPGVSASGPGRPLVISHRGSSGMLPEHSLPAYRLAIEQGADYLECDICITRDLQLICLHESWLGTVTDSDNVYRGRNKQTHYILHHDINITDHFSFDFTLKELRQLRLRQRQVGRDQTYNGRFTIPTFDEYVTLVKSANRTVGVYPELKDPDLVNAQDAVLAANTSLEELVAAALTRHGYTQPHHPCMLQSFRTPSLRRFSTLNGVRLIQLTKTVEPTLQQLRNWAKLVYGIGIAKDVLTNIDTAGRITSETGVVARAHSVGLFVHVYTFRNDETLAWNFQQDPYAEYHYYIDGLHIDGLFADFPATTTRFLACRRDCSEKAATNEDVPWTHVFVILTLALYPLYQTIRYCTERR